MTTTETFGPMAMPLRQHAKTSYIEDASGDIVATVNSRKGGWQERVDLIVSACNSHDALCASIYGAIKRAKIANAEGNPILSGWLPDAEAALAAAGEA